MIHTYTLLREEEEKRITKKGGWSTIRHCDDGEGQKQKQAGDEEKDGKEGKKLRLGRRRPKSAVPPSSAENVDGFTPG